MRCYKTVESHMCVYVWYVYTYIQTVPTYDGSTYNFSPSQWCTSYVHSVETILELWILILSWASDRHAIMRVSSQCSIVYYVACSFGYCVLSVCKVGRLSCGVWLVRYIKCIFELQYFKLRMGFSGHNPIVTWKPFVCICVHVCICVCEYRKK